MVWLALGTANYFFGCRFMFQLVECASGRASFSRQSARGRGVPLLGGSAAGSRAALTIIAVGMMSPGRRLFVRPGPEPLAVARSARDRGRDAALLEMLDSVGVRRGALYLTI